MGFIVGNIRFLSFGMALAFLSSFGQTYFIGVYRPAIAEEFDLSNSDFGLYYLMITIVSAVGLNRLGHIIDRAPLVPYTAVLMIAMALACLAVGLASHFWLLIPALMAVRLMGQGMLTHASMTSMSRYYDRNRGLAVAIAGLGFPLGQAVLPPLAVMLMAGHAWRSGWQIFAAALLVLALPLVMWLLKGQRTRHAVWRQNEDKANAGHAKGQAGHMRRRDVLRDRRFYLMLPALIAGPFWITAAFFFAAEFGVHAGLDLAEYTTFYGFYAAGSVAAPFLGGLLVDRFGGRHLMPLYPPVFGLSLLVMMLEPGSTGVILFMCLMGLGAGITLPINNAVWAELYGTRFLGEIKSLATSLVVVSTALAPFLVGIVLDAQVSLSVILMAGALYCALSTVLVVPVARQAGSEPFSRR